MKNRVLLTIFRDERGGMQGALRNVATVLEELGWEIQGLVLYHHEDGFEYEFPTMWMADDEKETILPHDLAAAVSRFSPSLIVNFACPYIHTIGLSYHIIERVATLYGYDPDPIHYIIHNSPNLVALIGQSEALVRILSGLAASRGVPVHWIPNFTSEIDIDVSASAITKAPPGFKVINISRNHPVKNLKAFCDVARECAELKFILVTNAPVDGVPSNVSVYVALSEQGTSELLESSDLYINLAYKEGISNATLRAFARGLPAILTDGDGITWYLAENAWVVDTFSVMPQNPRYVHNISQIAQWVRDLSTDHALLLRMGEASRRVAAHFNRDFVRKKWQKLLQEVLQ